MVNCHTMLRTLIPLTIYTMKLNPELHKKSRYIQPTWQVWGGSTFLVEIFLLPFASSLKVPVVDAEVGKASFI